MTTSAECARSASRGKTAKAPVAANLVWVVSEVATSPPDDSPNPVEPLVSTASMESILRTEELHRRPRRTPNYEMENRALIALTNALADSPRTILQTLAEKVLEALSADSAGVSLLTKDEKNFYWAAIAGAWQPHIGGGTPRRFGPCGDVLDRKAPMLFTHWERRYPHLRAATPLAEEGLVIPLCVRGKAVGTIWAIAHSERRRFDAEDLRLLKSLGRFALAVYQPVASIDELKSKISQHEEAEAAVRDLATGLQAKIRSLVDSNIIGIFMWRADGRIFEANEAYLRIIGYDRGDLLTGHLNWKDLTPPEWRGADDRRVAQLIASGSAQAYEKEYFRKDGTRVAVLVGATVFEGKSDEGVGFVLDLTERKRAEAELSESERRYREVQMELAHASRVATMGQLAASIAHEVKQPLAATMMDAETALRSLGRQPPDLVKAQQALTRIVQAGNRGSEVIERIRSLVKKAPPLKETVEINSAIREVIALTRGQTVKSGVLVQTELADDLPSIKGDRVQLQQVMLNLIVNAVEAMSEISEGKRELLISSVKTDLDGVVVAVRDSGPGLEPATLERLFESFHTTKHTGLGLGLSICRSIIEAHGGRLWATANIPRGAVLQFTLPAVQEIAS
jgi:PAS domain S-box-containing protein